MNLILHESDSEAPLEWSACLHGKDCYAMQINNVCDYICEYLISGNIYLKLLLHAFLISILFYFRFRF